MAGSSLGRTTGGSRALGCVVGLLWASCLLQGVVGKVVDFLPQGYFFDWTPQGQSPPVPTTAQCETINIKWGRQGATGPNPSAPYYLQVYTSAFIYPFVISAGSDLNFDWAVPFIPGTQYQICMFDKNGVTGGCQATYTVYQAPNSTLANPPTCQNLTYPQPGQVLGVEGAVSSGPISQYGWIDQCTDISLRPLNGTPPYTMTVAPALHPPYNITSNTMDPINWTVSLSWGAPFFISLVDSTGLMWSHGPLHSGGGGPTDCLTLEDPPTESGTIKSYVAVASGIGGLALGLLVGLISAIWFFRSRRKDRGRPDGIHRKSSSISITTPVLSSPPLDSGPYRDLPSPGFTGDSRHGLLRPSGSYHVEPFVMPSANELGVRTAAGPSSLTSTSPPTTVYEGTGRSNTQTVVDSQPRSGPPSSPTSAGHAIMQPPPPIQTEARTGSQVYVVHNDAGPAPVRVYTSDGTEVVELPPRYADSSSASGGPGSVTGASESNQGEIPQPQPRPVRTLPAAPLVVHETRQLGPSPPKGPRGG